MITTEKEEIVKNEILLQAQKLFQQYGLKKTTMDEIAESCGKAKSTLYHYFCSKEDVFDAVVDMEMLNLRRHVKNKVEENKIMADKIKVYILEFYKEIYQRTNLYRLIKNDHIAEKLSKKNFRRMMDFETAYMTRIIEDGYDSGEYMSVDRSEIPWFSEMFLAGFLGTVKYTMEKDGFFDEKKITKFTEMFIDKLFKQ